MNDDLEDTAARLTKVEGGAIEYRTKRKSYDAVIGPRSRNKPLKKWKYKLVVLDRRVLTDQKIEEEANKLGEQGWELVTITNPVWLFKYPE